MLKKSLIVICLGLLLFQCEEIDTLPASFYDQPAPFNDSSNIHPRGDVYQSILQQHQRQGLVGATLLVKDKDGLWIGAEGYADIANNVKMGPHSLYFIASISKAYTSAAVYRYVDLGLISLNDPIAQWLSQEIVDKVDNVDKATVGDLLSHRSGIRDFYTTQFELDRLNTDQN